MTKQQNFKRSILTKNQDTTHHIPGVEGFWGWFKKKMQGSNVNKLFLHPKNSKTSSTYLTF